MNSTCGFGMLHFYEIFLKNNKSVVVWPTHVFNIYEYAFVAEKQNSDADYIVSKFTLSGLGFPVSSL